MQTTIVYASYHHKNTYKVAKIFAEVLNARMLNYYECQKEDIFSADLVGFGSGVYYSKFHKGLYKLLDGLPDMDGKKAFVFSTAGMKKNFLLNRGEFLFKKKLREKNFEIVGEFDCLGFDTNSFLKRIGGINKGRPNEADLQKARDFAKNLYK